MVTDLTWTPQYDHECFAREPYFYKIERNTIESQMPRTESSQGPYRNKMKRMALKSQIVLSKIRFQKQNAGEHNRITEEVIK